MESSSLEQTLHDGNLYRQVNAFIVAHLRDNNLNQAASAVASATMTPLNVEAPPSKLLELVAKGLAVEKDEMLRGVSSSPLFDSGVAIPAGYGSIPGPRVVAVDFSAVHDTKGGSKSFPKHETRHVSEHKNVARCARFSPDGRFLATGSADTSIKLFEVIKIKQMMLPDAKDGPVRPVVRTFYDHLQPVNDIDFHPHNTVMITGAKDHTINFRFFDFSKTVAKRAFRVIQDTHNVRSVAFHPSGDFVLAVVKGAPRQEVQRGAPFALGAHPSKATEKRRRKGAKSKINANSHKSVCSLLRKGFCGEAVGSWHWKIGKTISGSYTHAIAMPDCDMGCNYSRESG